MKYLVVGAGLSGSTFARIIAEKGHTVTVLEKRNAVAGNAFDEVVSDGYRHLYGPHLFHTNSEKVAMFLSRFTGWSNYTHTVRAHVNGKYIPLPFNLESIETLFPKTISDNLTELLLLKFGFDASISLDELLKFNPSSDGSFGLYELGSFISKKIVQNYSKKAWGRDVFSLDENIRKRVPIRVNYDDRYFTDKFQALPNQGYTSMVESMLDDSNIEIQLGVDFKTLSKEEINSYDKVYYTGMIDEYFDYCFGDLPYRDVKFHFAQCPAQKDYPTTNYPDHMFVTRETDFSYMDVLNTKNPWIVIETPLEYDKNDKDAMPYYPVTSAESKELYNKYLELKPDNVIFGGRLGRFEYLNMDQAVAQAMMLAEKE